VARAILIANPAAARTRGTTVREIAAVFAEAGWTLEVAATTGPGDARILARAAVADRADLVAVFGGDGTTMQAAAELVGTGVILAPIPGGTGNLLAGNLRLPVNPVRAARAIVSGTPRALDLGRVERFDGEHYFAVACGAGADARVMVETPTALKQRWRMMAYIATTFRILPELTSVPYEIVIDGVRREAEAAMVLVANCGQVIPRLLSLGSGITPYDGMLDVVLLQTRSVAGTFRAMWDLVREARGTYGHDVFVDHAAGREVRVRTLEGTAPVQLDGEPGGATPFTATVVPGAIRVMHPGTSR
jgi:YegS/Rv2252/BmrU family lipid kinase